MTLTELTEPGWWNGPWLRPNQECYLEIKPEFNLNDDYNYFILYSERSVKVLKTIKIKRNNPGIGVVESVDIMEILEFLTSDFQEYIIWNLDFFNGN